ncbi:MAG: radical SAM family heme chaperone HemW [Polyangiaceae bacterium]|nr:radical SAM family heme chaperone HemW [Polyangiaceae bacterium]
MASALGIYVHFPWCLKKCPYCDFLSLAQPDRSVLPHESYADQVLRELDARLDQGFGELRGCNVGSVFFGGGTPSLWDPSALGRVLVGILERFPHHERCEITVECNPTSLDLDHANRLADVGVNRLSLGIQGTDDQRLKFLGRLHDAEAGLSALAQAVASRVPRVSGDLIFGVAGQTPAEARQEVAQVADLGVEHLSAYSLTIEPGTQFGALARKGRLPQLPDDLVAEAYLEVEAELARRGFVHYEISNYAQPGCESRHNLGYWRGSAYLGLGCGAWGTLALGRSQLPWGSELEEGALAVRYRNQPSAERYLAAGFGRAFSVGEGVRELEPLHAETLLSERLMLGLRLREGLDLGATLRELQLTLGEDRERAVRRALQAGMLEGVPEQGSLTGVEKETANSSIPALPLDLGRVRIPPAEWLRADAVITRLM